MTLQTQTLSREALFQQFARRYDALYQEAVAAGSSVAIAAERLREEAGPLNADGQYLLKEAIDRVDRIRTAQSAIVKPESSSKPQTTQPIATQPVQSSPEQVVAPPHANIRSTSDPRLLELGDRMALLCSDCHGVNARFACIGATSGNGRVAMIRLSQIRGSGKIVQAKHLAVLEEFFHTMGLVKGRISVVNRFGYIGLEMPIEGWRPLPMDGVFERALMESRGLKPGDPLIIECGLGVEGEPIRVNLSQSSGAHLLIGGRTGGGKNGCINTIVTYMIARYRFPWYWRFCFTDFQRLNSQRHRKFHPWHWGPGVITTAEEFAEVYRFVPPCDRTSDNAPTPGLVWQEVERREDLMLLAEAENFDQYNQVAYQDYLARYRQSALPIDAYNSECRAGLTAPRRSGQRPCLPILPHLLLFVDELAAVGDHFPDRISKLWLGKIARETRKYGFHLLPATQNCGAGANDPLDGSFRDQFGYRVALQCGKAASEKILGDGNEEASCLQGEGDSYLLSPGGYPQRLQWYYTSPELLDRICQSIVRDYPSPQELPQSPAAALPESPFEFADAWG